MAGFKIEKKLVIKEGMTVDYVKQHGNSAQRMAAAIFDNDALGDWGSGTYSKQEAETFNRCIFKLETDKLTIYDPKMQKNGSRGMTEIPILNGRTYGCYYRDNTIGVGHGEGVHVTVREPEYFDRISVSDKNKALVQNAKGKTIVSQSGKTTITNCKVNEIVEVHGGECELINTTNRYNGAVKAYVNADNFDTEEKNIQSVKYDKNSKVKFY